MYPYKWYVCNLTPGNVKNRFDLEIFGSSEINTIYTSLPEHSQNHPILLSILAHHVTILAA